MGESIVYAIKVALVLACFLAFASAITALVSAVSSIVFHNVVGEIFAVINACLPFDFGVVAGTWVIAFSAMLSFLISQKIFNLLIGSYSAT